MQKQWLMMIVVLVLANSLPGKAQYNTSDTAYRRWFVGSSMFVLLGNLSTINAPHFVQVNVGYRITGKDVVSIEPKTWKYAWPNGIHPFFNKAYGKPEEKFPGYVREFGLSLAYQRFFSRHFYAELNVMPTLQYFVHNSGHKTDKGFQLFNTYRVGYHIKMLKDRLFLQPSLAITHRACHTPLPNGFKQLDDKWSKFVFGEPGLHIGINL